MNTIGIVAIGRNEGARLIACLESLGPAIERTVYVDSGSTDGSVAAARQRGAEVVELDTSIPFTAARARNAGLRRLLEKHHGVEFVQFIDGDCSLVGGWLEAAAQRLREEPTLAVVCGRRHERHREATVYNRLADMEWNTPVGPARACGGDALYRVDALQRVGGFDDARICGEEPELCARLRHAGFGVERIDHDMTLHDAAMTRFGQWWKRTVRGGWASAQAMGHAAAEDRRAARRRALSVWGYGVVVPAAALGLAWPTWGLSVAAALALDAQLAWRVARHRRARGESPADARLYAWFCVIGKTAEAVGQARYALNRLSGRRATLIEYKGDGAAATT